MTRRAVAFACGSARLWGMVDSAGHHGGTGLLIVSGGNEIRAGAFAGQAQLAAWLAEDAGVPVFRFDRRGVGDSEGENTGWRGSRDDIAAAIAAFRGAVPGLRRVVAYGVCDAAAALMLHAPDLHGPNLQGLDGLVLANPWTFDDDAADSAGGHSPGALRRRYWAKLTNPQELWRLVRGQVDLRRLLGGLAQAARPREAATPIVATLHEALMRGEAPATVLISAGDRVGQRFLAVWPAGDPRVQVHPGASHSFMDDPDTAAWLYQRLVEATASRH